MDDQEPGPSVVYRESEHMEDDVGVDRPCPEQQPPKRGRGRPRKYATHEEYKRANAQSQLRNRPVGRPRKFATDAERQLAYRERKKNMLQEAQARKDAAAEKRRLQIAKQQERQNLIAEKKRLQQAKKDEQAQQAQVIARRRQGVEPAETERHQKEFIDNPLGIVCDVCGRIWIRKVVRKTMLHSHVLHRQLFPEGQVADHVVCSTCAASPRANKVPNHSTTNGYVYPFLPKLNLVSERLVSPRIPFMQRLQLRLTVFNTAGQFGIKGELVNVPIDVCKAVNLLTCYPSCL